MNRADGVGGTGRRAAPSTVMATDAGLSFDHVVQSLRHPAQHLVGLRLCDPAGLDRRVELLLQSRLQLGLQSGGRLALGLGDLREGLARLELGAQLRLGQTEVRSRRPEHRPSTAAWASVMPVAEPAGTPSTEEREPTFLRPLFHRVSLLLRELACRDRSIYTGAVGALQRRLELGRRHVEALRGVVQERLTLGVRAESATGDRDAGADSHDCSHDDADDDSSSVGSPPCLLRFEVYPKYSKRI